MFKSQPHLVPANLVGQQFPKSAFEGTKVALIGYCPPPEVLEAYAPEATHEQYFIHVSPGSVKQLSYKGINILSLEHIYGGPVSSSTIEELAYYDFDYVLAYGLAGGLGTKALQMGDIYLVETAQVADGTTTHYTNKPVIPCDKFLKESILKSFPSDIHPVQATTGDAIYREDEALLNKARQAGSDIINLDSSHLYAASQINSEGRIMQTIQCGVISDVVSEAVDARDSKLSVMLSNKE